MHQRLKERLVGAAVLVVIAVIFIPMLLTGPIDSGSITRTNIPDRPTEKFNSKLIPLTDSLKPVTLSIFQQFSRGHSPRGDDVYPLSVVTQAGGRHSVRAGYRHLPRDGTVLVEPVRSDVCQRDQETTHPSPVIFAMALAPG